jgi:hypothetical protein
MFINEIVFVGDGFCIPLCAFCDLCGYTLFVTLTLSCAITGLLLKIRLA